MGGRKDKSRQLSDGAPCLELSVYCLCLQAMPSFNASRKTA